MSPSSGTSSISILTSNKCSKRRAAKKNLLSEHAKCNNNLERLGNFFWYHGRLGKKETCELLEQNGQFLVRLARSKMDLQMKAVLSVKWNNRHYHFGIKKSGEYFTIEELLFDNIIQLISFYFASKHPLTRQSNAILLQPLYRYVEIDAPYILKEALNLAVACIIVIFLYLFVIK